MILLSCTNLCKFYGVEPILKNINFHVNNNDKIGIVGSNGAGKTTLLKILTGDLSFDSGKFYLSQHVSLGYMEQNNNLETNDTVYAEALKVFSYLIQLEDDIRILEQEIALNSENPEILEVLMKTYSEKSDLFVRLDGYSYSSLTKGTLKGLGFTEDDFTKTISTLSGGQKTRLSLAKLLLKKPDLLFLDEPTNHLDIEALEWLESYLRTYTGTLLVVSHDRYFLDQVTNMTIEIENHGLKSYSGNYSYFTEKKQADYVHSLRAYEKNKKEIARQEEMILRFKQHGTEKLAKRASSREKKLEKTEVTAKPELIKNDFSIKFEPQISSGKKVLDIEDLSKSFGTNKLFENLSLHIEKGEKICMIGTNGTGKTTLFKMILSQLRPDHGHISIGHNVNIGYFDQEQESLNLNKLVIDEIWDDHPKFNEPKIRGLLGSFLFKNDDVFKQVALLSGGEKSRLALLKLMLSDNNFLLMDEPTNHLDMISKELLENALLNYTGTILAISHDRYFLNKVATKIISLSQEGLSEYLGNYDYYQEKKDYLNALNDDAEPEIIVNKTKLKETRKKEKEKTFQQKKHQKRLKSLEAEIASLESSIVELEEQMCLEEIYSNPEKSLEIHQQKTNCEQSLQNLYTEWETLLEVEMQTD